jgi:lipopolysaccharide assembly outer membrane protein LptD (OstA)
LGGYDAIENGERISAGFESSIYNSERRWFNAFIGRSNNIGNRQKMKFDGRNAMVGRLVLKPIESMSFRMRFVGMPFSEKMRLFESGTNISYKNIFGGIGYYYEAKKNKSNVNEGLPVPKEGLSQIGINCGVKLTEFWSISGSEILNLQRKSGKRSLARGIAAVYKDECFEFGIGMYRTNFKDKDIKPNTGIALTIIFKNLGSLAKSRSWHRYNTEIGTVA